ncbi:MAG TPA: SDR family oxidoreductase [Bradyrhizobium sp.]|nr:SDR family oxidoreductase [Bradyrhizobium sp.]
MTFSHDLLAGKAALVTGGGTGICRGIALALAAHGCDVAITSRKVDHLEPTAREIESLGRRSVALPADVRDPSAIEEVVTRAAAKLGRLDVLVNGAAGNFLCLAEDLSPNAFSSVIDIDLKGTFHATKAALPHLKKSRGVVLNISATLQYLGTPSQVHASAAKAGIDALTRGLAVEWGAYGIRVNGIAPGPIAETEGVRRLMVGPAKRRVEQKTPLGRLGAIEDVSNAALFLCSSAASHITGVTLVVDGGLWLASGWMAEASAAAAESLRASDSAAFTPRSSV